MVCLSWDGKLQLCFPSKMFLAVSETLTHKKKIDNKCDILSKRQKSIWINQ